MCLSKATFQRETPFGKIYSDLVISTCQDQTSLLILLDLSTAFDIVDHGVLIKNEWCLGFSTGS